MNRVIQGMEKLNDIYEKFKLSKCIVYVIVGIQTFVLYYSVINSIFISVSIWIQKEFFKKVT
jgi:hypothetical protein